MPTPCRTCVNWTHDAPGRGANPGSRLKHITLDGTNIAANASKHKTLPDGLNMPTEIARHKKCLNA